jgi:putative endonuclease
LINLAINCQKVFILSEFNKKLAKHLDTGKKGEAMALDYYLRNGYMLLHRNWRWQKVEIDLIVRTKQELVFVEVKTRSNTNYGRPEQAVDTKKQRHLINGANAFAEQYAEELDCRFDVISIVLTSQEVAIHHIPNAFYPEDEEL